MEIVDVVEGGVVGATQVKGPYNDTLLFTATIRIGVPHYSKVLPRKKVDDPLVICLQRPMRGGYLGLYITTRDLDKYSEEPRVMGLNLYERCNTKKKSRHLFGRLFDTDQTAPTHALVVHERVSWHTPPPDHVRFIAPEPLVGEVIFIPLVFSHRHVNGVESAAVVVREDIRDRARMPAKGKPDKNDPESYLNKLLSQGWRLQSRSGRDCVLTRRGRTIQYRVPKK